MKQEQNMKPSSYCVVVFIIAASVHEYAVLGFQHESMLTWLMWYCKWNAVSRSFSLALTLSKVGDLQLLMLLKEYWHEV